MTKLTKEEYMKLMGHTTSKSYFILLTIVMILIVVGLIALKVWVMMSIWNYVVTTLFNLPVITFWQMFMLDVLVNLFLGFFNIKGGKK